MKKNIILTSILLLLVGQSFAHALWIATNQTGEIGKEQEIKVYFGEFTYGVIEEVGKEAYNNVKDFSLWVISPSGEKVSLEVSPMENHYLTSYTPEEEGTYTVVLNNDKINVMDYSQYDFGIFKPHYHSVAKIQVGKTGGSTQIDNSVGITLKNLDAKEGQVNLQVLFKGEALPETEVKIFVADQWSKTLTTDKEGMTSFALPWNTDYLVEVTTEERVPGTYKDEAYEFVWHCVTQYIRK